MREANVADGMLLLVQGYVDLAPRLLLEELFYRIEQAPSWNPTLVECRTVQVHESLLR
jgi:hypothetical protein